MKSSDQLFRQAAEAENGMPISAGARIAHVRLAIESGRTVVVDFSGVPEDRRPALLAEIKELVNKASAQKTCSDTQPTSKSAKRSG
jgi:hypothetical protein